MVQAVTADQWIFNAYNSNPQYGRARSITNGVNEVRYGKDTLMVYLPYFGRLYSGTDVLNNRGPLDFTSTDFSTTKENGNSGWVITIKPKDQSQVQSMVFSRGKFSLYQDLTVQENLDFFATIFNTSVEENYDLIKDIYSQIEPFKDRRAGKLSGGMKQKLALSCALIHRPSVLFLDEPTTGVDAVSRKEFWEMLKKLKEQDITILVSTPYMDEAGMCDRVALMQNGKILSIDTPQGVVNAFGKKLLAVKSSNMIRLLNELKNCEYVEDAYPFGEYHHAVMKNGGEQELSNYLQQAGHPFELKETQPDIEDCFMALMKN
ncbi:MAG: DUF4251 domain-containing protein [Bacteroidota bacterium]